MKQSIMHDLLTYYHMHKQSPKYNDPSIRWSPGTVRVYFGSHANALTECNIPIRMNKPLMINCDQCCKSFTKQCGQIRKSNNHFCSHSCSATYSNLRRIMNESTKQKISTFQKQNTIVSLDAMYKTIECKICGIGFTLKGCRDQRTICSDICRRKMSSISGKIGGRNSQANCPRRSKGEILFYDLCVKYFSDTEVLSNQQLFKDNNDNYWDADIIIPKYKLAICYNGIWHYEQVRTKHSLKQVQSRDRIKSKIIFNNGYIEYIIKDLGKFDQMFVYEQFHIFIFRTFIHLELKMI